MKINDEYLDPSFQVRLQTAFKDNVPFSDTNTGAILRNHPFQVITLPNFVDESEHQYTAILGDEILQLLVTGNKNFHHRQCDLYDFYQTGDLLGANCDFSSVHINQVKQLFSEGEVRSFINGITGIGVSPGRIDIAAQVYPPRSYLLCHDDSLEGRLFAWVLYLFKEELVGGDLELFGVQKKGENGNSEKYYPSIVVDRVRPVRNMLVLFPVSVLSFHAVSEVVSGTRVSIAGWFYFDGPVGPYIPSMPQNAEKAASYETTMDSLGGTSVHIPVNQFYKNQRVQSQIARTLKRERVVSLVDFMADYIDFSPTMEKSGWALAGPPNFRHCWFLPKEEAFYTKLIMAIMDFSFDLFPRSLFTLISTNVFMYQPGSYQVIHDDFCTGSPHSIDVLYFLTRDVHNAGGTSRVRYSSVRDKKKGEEEVIDIDPYATPNTLYLVSVQKNTQISISYLTLTALPFIMIALRLQRADNTQGEVNRQ